MNSVQACRIREETYRDINTLSTEGRTTCGGRNKPAPAHFHRGRAFETMIGILPIKFGVRLDVLAGRYCWSE
jgi:hypothetical protein